jgi:hypothetical protein
MTTAYRGIVRNGVVVFDGATPLADGTTVRVEPVEGSGLGTRPAGRPGSRDAVLAFAGVWAGAPSEVDRLLGDVQRMREDDVELQRRRDALNGELPS